MQNSFLINNKISERLCSGLSVEKAQVSPSGDVRENNVVTVTCLNPYVLLGNHKVTCLSTGWSVVPECREFGESELQNLFNNLNTVFLNFGNEVSRKTTF